MKRGVVLVCLLLGAIGCGPVAVTPSVSTSKPSPKWTREEFAAKVKVGMTREQVIEAVGPPSSTTAYGGDSELWMYDHSTLDHVTGSVDLYAQVKLKDGVVTSAVSFMGGISRR